MPKFSIRARQNADLDSACALLRDVYDTDGYPVEGAADAVAWLTPPELLEAWVAVDPTLGIIGHVLVSRPLATTKAVDVWVDRGASRDTTAVLGRLFVSSRARGHGVGAALTAEANRWAEQKGLRLVLDVMSKDVAAIKLYQSLGWQNLGSSTHGNGHGGTWKSVLFVSPGAT